MINKNPIILFCCFPDALREPDPAFYREWQALEELGIEWRVFSFDAFLDGNYERAFKYLKPGAGEAILYRGWILREHEYALLESRLRAHGYILFTSSASYALASYLPNYYNLIRHYTPPARWTFNPDPEEAWRLAQELGVGAYIIKDHIKSAKEHWREACYIPERPSKTRFIQTCNRLIQIHGDRFERGFVIRKAVPLRYIEESPFGYPLFEEHRIFFFNKKPLVSAPYNRGGPVADVSSFHFLGALIDSPFFTADVARVAGEDSSRNPESEGLTLIEVGDAGVSGLPAAIDHRSFYITLRENWGS